MAIADIHLHLDGSISMQAARSLVECVGGSFDLTDEELYERLHVREGCHDLNEYLDKFDFTCGLLQTQTQLALSARLLLEELDALGVAYAELRFAPQRQTWRGLTQREAVEAVIAGMQDAPIACGLVLCCMRGDDNARDNDETVELAGEYLGQGVCALDLAGAEALFPTASFAPLFARASKLGIPYTVHAGEADGPESVRAALAMGAKRIGHGVRAAEDPALLAQLANEKVTCELCPTSNLNTSVFDSYEQFPLPAFLEAGVPVAICSDNMSVSNTSVVRELAIMEKTFSLDEATMRELEGNAFKAAFAWEGARA